MTISNDRDQTQIWAELKKLAYSLLSIEQFPNIGKLLERIAESAKEVLKADLIEIYEYRQDQNRYELPQIVAGKRLDTTVPKVKIHDDDAIWQMIHRTTPLYTENAGIETILTVSYSVDRKDVPKERFVLREKIQSMAAIPLRTADESMGLMFANYRSPQTFTSELCELIELFASQAAVAIKNMRLFQQERDQAKALTELNILAQDLISIEKAPDTKILLKKIAERAKDVLRADLIELYEYRQDQNRYKLPQISVGKTLGPSIPKDKIYEDDAVFQLIKRLEPLYESNAQGKSVFTTPYIIRRDDQPSERFVIREKIQSTAAIPLRTESESMGLLFSSYRTPQTFTKEQRELIELFAKQAAIALKNARLYYYVNQRRKALVKIGQKLTTEIHLREDEILELVYEQASKLLGFENLSLALYDGTTDTVRFALAESFGRRVDVEKEPGWEPRQGGRGKTERVIRSKRYLSLATQEEVRKAGFSQVPGQKDRNGSIANSWLGVPMIVGEKVLGVIATEEYGRDNFYDDDDIEILQALADQAAIAIDNARFRYDAIRRLSDMNRRRKAVVNFGSQISSKILQGENEILKFIHEQAHQLMDTDNMYIALYDDSTDIVRFGLAFKNGERIQVESRKAGKGRTEEIIRTGKPIFIETRKKSEEWYKQPGRAEYIGDPLASWIGVPMRDVNNKVIGVVANYHPTEDYVYSRDDLDILQSMADLAAIALANARLYEEAKRLRDEKVAGEQLATLGTAMAALQHRISNTFDIIVPNLTRLKSRVNEQDSTVADIFDIIERNARATSDIIRRIQEPLREIEPQSVQINAVLDEEVKKAKDKWKIGSVSVNLKLDDSIPQIRVPSGQIAEVFSNLLDNAYRAMSEKAGELNVSSFVSDNSICVRFQDTGPGIQPEVQSRLFIKPVPVKGSGLGLWLSQLILKGIRGSIKIEKSDSTGTTMLVQISLPAVDRDGGRL